MVTFSNILLSEGMRHVSPKMLWMSSQLDLEGVLLLLEILSLMKRGRRPLEPPRALVLADSE